MKTLKAVSIVLVVAAVLLSVCASTPVVAEKEKVFFLNQQVGHPFWNIVMKGVYDACHKYGFECAMDGPTTLDNPAMISIAEAAIATGEYDAMIIPAIVPEMLTPVINEAIDAGIEVVVFCTDAPESKRKVFVGTGGAGGGFPPGQEAGKFLVKLAGGEPCKINVISGLPDQTDLNERIEGLKSVLPPNMEVTSIDYGPGGIKENIAKLEARLLSDPDVNCFFGAMAEGGPAIMSVYPDYKERLDKAHIVMFDDLDVTLDGVREGVIDATTVQCQYRWGFGSIYYLHRILHEGLECPEFTDTGVVMVTKDNVDTYAEETKNPQMFIDMEGKTLEELGLK